MRLYILGTTNECMSEWRKGSKDTREEKGKEEVI
jgi:hypothetical protein